MSIDKTQLKADMAEFKRHKKACCKFEDALDGLCDTFAHSMLDHLARALDRLYGGRKFMDEACK